MKDFCFIFFTGCLSTGYTGCSLGEKFIKENVLCLLNTYQVVSLRYSNRTLYFWRVLSPNCSVSFWVPQIQHPELQFVLAVVYRIISILPTPSPDFLIFPWHRYPPHSCLAPTRGCVFLLPSNCCQFRFH